ncbi:MAG: hypothetical protein PHR36_02780 [Patescibacteria group bacterium]|nr:hypothetical protein [Patescibacteria group bacterium]
MSFKISTPVAMSFDISTLVDHVVTIAKTDKTVPKRKNLREGWWTDSLLTRFVDALVLGKYDNPAAYAEIGRRVLEEVKGLPEMEVLAMLAILRGERLRPLDEERQELINGLSEALKVAISALPRGTRKKRCQELFLYHMGVFYDALGRFDLAADTQEWAAREAGRGSSSAAISLFLAAVYRLKYGLFVDRSSEELGTIFSSLEEKFARLAETLRGSELQVQWVQGNCPVHMILACIWLNRSHQSWDEWLNTALAAAEKLGKGWEPGAEFIRAANLNLQNGEGAEKVLRAAVENRAANNETRATALFLLARRALRGGDKEGARSLINQMPKQGAQHVQAIAERILK